MMLQYYKYFATIILRVCYFSITNLLQGFRRDLRRGRFSYNSIKYLLQGLRRVSGKVSSESPAKYGAPTGLIFVFSLTVFCFNEAKANLFL
jgi:hypothetical protein